MEKESLGKPICFFTKLEYGNFSDVPDYASDILGEENAEIHYTYKELKSGKEEKGKAFYNFPNYPVSIHAVKDAINIEEYGEGDYGINPSINYDECVNTLEELLSSGVNVKDITSLSIKQKLQGHSHRK